MAGDRRGHRFNQQFPQCRFVCALASRSSAARSGWGRAQLSGTSPGDAKLGPRRRCPGKVRPRRSARPRASHGSIHPRIHPSPDPSPRIHPRCGRAPLGPRGFPGAAVRPPVPGGAAPPEPGSPAPPGPVSPHPAPHLPPPPPPPPPALGLPRRSPPPRPSPPRRA